MTLDSAYIGELWRILSVETLNTAYMVFFSSLWSVIIGFAMGITQVVTEPGGIAPNKVISSIMSGIINVGRSIPFVILIIAVFPLSRLILGKGIGTTAAIVPLTVAAAPFAARIVESALKEIDTGIVEAAQAMGASNWQIVTKVLLPEASQSLVLGVTIIIINIIGYSAMAGTIGGGGLGDVAIRFGYQRFRTDLLYATIIILVVMVQIIQAIGNAAAKRLDKKK